MSRYKALHVSIEPNHFRTWKSGKKWLYGTTALIVLAGGFSGASQPFYISSLIASAATVQSGVGTIVQGSAWDTGNHAYSSTDVSNIANYTMAGTTTRPTGTNWFNLVNNTQNSAGYAVFNGAIATTSSFSITATIKAESITTLSGANWMNAGDALGFILTPVSSTQLTTGATGYGLGIQNLPNTYFLGRDLYYNAGWGYPGVATGNGVDGSATGSLLGGPYSFNGSETIVAIRSTNSGGTLQQANYNNPGTSTTNTQANTTTGQAWADLPDPGSNNILGTDSTVQEVTTISWVPDATNTAPTGYTSGILTMSITPQAGGTATVIQTHTNLQNSMSLGFLGATGGNYGNLSVSLNGATGTAARGTAPVQVNYYQTGTTKPVSNWQPSSITANVADKVGVLAPGGTATSTPGIPSGTYNYVAPVAPAGYTYNSVSSSITVQNYASGTTDPNVINVYYTPSSQQANFSYAWDSSVPGQNGVPGKLQASLPTTQSVTGVTDGSITAPTLAAPTGYYISGYKAPNGTIFPTLAAALASATGPAGAADTYGATSNTSSPSTYTPNTNDFQVILSANTQTYYVNYGYAYDSYGNTPPFPTVINFQGLTGAPVSTPSLPPTPPTGYHYSGARTGATGAAFYWVDKVDPTTNGAISPTYADINSALTAAIAAENGGYFGATSLSTSPANGATPTPVNNASVMLTANKETANYTYQLAAGAPAYPPTATPSFPQNTTSTGGFGDNIASNSSGINSPGNNYATFVAPPSDVALSGYTMSVLGPDNKTYPTVAAATAATYFQDGASANNFVITYTPVQNVVTWTYHYDGTTTGNPTKPLPSPVTQSILTGGSNTDPGSLAAPSGYYISSYSYNGVNYPTVAALIQANPIVTASENISINVSDATAISSKPTDMITASSAWTPSTDITTAKNGDNTNPSDTSIINGNKVLVTIVNDPGTPAYSYSGNASTPLPANTLAKGNYTVTYTTYKSDGTTPVTSITKLQVTNFVLPFAGGEGTAGLAGLAGVAAALAAGLQAKRRKSHYKGIHQKT